MDDLIADFLTETSENIADLDVALLKLERTPDDQDTLSLIFRLVHTIKGTCGFLGLPRLEHVAHAAENVLGKVRDGVLTATPDTVTLVLAALDRIKAILGGLAATGSEVAGDDGELIEALNATAAGEAPKPAAPVVAAEPEPEAELRRNLRRSNRSRQSRRRRRGQWRRVPWCHRSSRRASRWQPTRPSASPSMCWKT